jgi:hypothetical protein
MRTGVSPSGVKEFGEAKAAPEKIGSARLHRGPRAFVTLVDSELAQLAGLPATRYTYGLDLARQDRGPAVTGGAVETRYFGYDGLGSVRHLTDTAGTITDTYSYDAFGLTEFEERMSLASQSHTLKSQV